MGLNLGTGGWRVLDQHRPVSMECGLVAGEVLVHLLDTAVMPLSNVLNQGA